LGSCTGRLSIKNESVFIINKNKILSGDVQQTQIVYIINFAIYACLVTLNIFNESYF